MNRGPGWLLTADDSRRVEVPAPPAASDARRGLLHRLLTGFGDSCALVGAALLGCLALIALGTVGSLAWTLLVER